MFAGAGISTEARTVLKTTFYESVAVEIDESHFSSPFPELMEKYCQQPNGRFKLLRNIKDRFDHIDSFPELARSASRFHRELGTFFPIRNIITTNWDTYFERYCKATPFVTDPDLAFWEAADRRVLKIHGSVTNYGSIIATTGDYQECQERLSSGLIGGLLKTILATQTVIFIGYSLSDSDFSAIYEFVKQQMKSLHRQAYVVTPFIQDCEKFKAEGFIPIQTDGAYFLSQIKAHAVACGVMLEDEIFGSAFELLKTVFDEHTVLHESAKASDFPEVIYTASYQDGLMHALERAIEMRGSGRYSSRSRIIKAIHEYLKIKKEKLKHGIYEDVAYIEGYINGLTYLSMAGEERNSIRVPTYFLFGANADIYDIQGFFDELKRNPKIHKAAHKRAAALLKRLANPKSIEFHHPPWL
ncbi:MAG: hypothetical protein NVSMB6_20680 [Burkholderiaceae bacterium]